MQKLVNSYFMCKQSKIKKIFFIIDWKLYLRRKRLDERSLFLKSVIGSDTSKKKISVYFKIHFILIFQFDTRLTF